MALCCHGGSFGGALRHLVKAAEKPVVTVQEEEQETRENNSPRTVAWSATLYHAYNLLQHRSAGRVASPATALALACVAAKRVYFADT